MEAPHICGVLNLSAQEASQIAGLLRADERRLRQTMADIDTNSALVQEGRRLVESNLSASVSEAKRQMEKEKLARRFGRLKEEYELLEIQGDVLGCKKQKEAGQLVTTSASGKVVKSK